MIPIDFIEDFFDSTVGKVIGVALLVCVSVVILLWVENYDKNVAPYEKTLNNVFTYSINIEKGAVTPVHLPGNKEETWSYIENDKGERVFESIVKEQTGNVHSIYMLDRRWEEHEDEVLLRYAGEDKKTVTVDVGYWPYRRGEFQP